MKNSRTNSNGALKASNVIASIAEQTNLLALNAIADSSESLSNLAQNLQNII